MGYNRKVGLSEGKGWMARLVVGLGNPGREYEGTRHNIGFEVIEELSSRLRIPVTKRQFEAVLGDGRVGDQRVILARPMTYMNHSGNAVGAICRMYRIPAEDVMVIADDIALPPGRLRLRLAGSCGGHNGLESVERALGSRLYPRIRIGVGGAPNGQMVGYVLGRFRPEERELVREAVMLAADAVETALGDGFERAMNRFNGLGGPPKPAADAGKGTEE